MNDVLENIDSSINELTREVLSQLREDRDRAEQTYLELLNLFNQGKNSPSDVRELNLAQDKIQNSTAQLQRLVESLVKIKVGEAKIQIAQVNAPDGRQLSKADVIAILEQEGTIDEKNIDGIKRLI